QWLRRGGCCLARGDVHAKNRAADLNRVAGAELALSFALDFLAGDEGSAGAAEVFDPVVTVLRPDARVGPRDVLVRSQVEVDRRAGVGASDSDLAGIALEDAILVLELVRDSNGASLLPESSARKLLTRARFGPGRSIIKALAADGNCVRSVGMPQTLCFLKTRNGLLGISEPVEKRSSFVEPSHGVLGVDGQGAVVAGQRFLKTAQIVQHNRLVRPSLRILGLDGEGTLKAGQRFR